MMKGTKQKADFSAFAKKLRRLRQQRGWSLGDLAEIMEKDRANGASYLSRLENNHANPGEDTLSRLSEIFGLEIWDLLRSETEEGVPREKVMAVHYSKTAYDINPNKTKIRRLLVDQLDRILEHPELAEAIAANLKAFASAAEYRNEIAALNKKIDELTIQVKILSDALRRNAPGCAELSPDPGDDRKRAIREGLP